MQLFMNSAITIILLLMASPGHTAVIIDTGSNSAGTSWTFDYTQGFAGEFSVGSAYTVHSIEGFFGNQGGGAGNVTISIHADGGNIPGNVLFSAPMSLAANVAPDWYGLSGLGWNIGAGTYWVSFVTDLEISGSMPGNAPDPLDEYGQYSGQAWLDLGENYFDYLELGIRMDGTQVQAVPEPAGLALTGFGLAALGFSRRRAKPAESLFRKSPAMEMTGIGEPGRCRASGRGRQRS